MKNILILLVALVAMLFTGCLTTGSTKNELALIEVAGEGNTARVKELIAQGVNIEAKDDSDLTALINAAVNGHTMTVEVLIEAGADIEAKDTSGRTVFLWATAGGHTETAEILIVAGTDVNARDKDGMTSLIHAAYYGHVDMVELLLVKGADIDAKNQSGRTALSMASGKGHIDTVELLLAKGADIGIKDTDGYTALLRAIQVMKEETMLVLLEATAISDAKNILNSYAVTQSDDLLESMKLLQKTLDNTMSTYSTIWNDSATLVLLTAEACNTTGANALLDELFQVIIDKAKVLDKIDYANTLKCYAILAEYKNLLQNLSGSFVEFNVTKARLNSEFQQAMALAVLE